MVWGACEDGRDWFRRVFPFPQGVEVPLSRQEVHRLVMHEGGAIFFGWAADEELLDTNLEASRCIFDECAGLYEEDENENRNTEA